MQHLVKTLTIPDLNQPEACSVSQEHLDPAGIHNRLFHCAVQKSLSFYRFQIVFYMYTLLHTFSSFLNILPAYLAEQKIMLLISGLANLL